MGNDVTEAHSDEGEQELDVSDGSNVSSEPVKQRKNCQFQFRL